MKVKNGIKIYYSIQDVREFTPDEGEFFVFILKNELTGKEEIFVEEANKRNIGQFWNLDDAFRYAKFKKDEGDINQLFEKYEHIRDQLNKVVNNLDLRKCKKCKNFHQKEHVCYECGYDESGDFFHK